MSEDTAAVVLCGGRSQRMGQPKAWLPFDGERLLPRVVRLVSVAADPVIVVAAPGQELPSLPGQIVTVRDPIPGRGPLQGLAVGLKALPRSSEYCFATATDAPFLNPSWIRFLRSRIGEYDMAIPWDGDRHYPLAALYRCASVLPVVEALLAAQQLRLSALIDLVKNREVSTEELRSVDPGLATLHNLNTPEDYHSALLEARRPRA